MIRHSTSFPITSIDRRGKKAMHINASRDFFGQAGMSAICSSGVHTPSGMAGRHVDYHNHCHVILNVMLCIAITIGFVLNIVNGSSAIDQVFN